MEGCQGRQTPIKAGHSNSKFSELQSMKHKMCTTVIFGVPTRRLLCNVLAYDLSGPRVYALRKLGPRISMSAPTPLRHWEMGIRRLTSKARISRTNLQIYGHDMLIMLLRGPVSGF